MIQKYFKKPSKSYKMKKQVSTHIALQVVRLLGTNNLRCVPNVAADTLHPVQVILIEHLSNGNKQTASLHVCLQTVTPVIVWWCKRFFPGMELQQLLLLQAYNTNTGRFPPTVLLLSDQHSEFIWSKKIYFTGQDISD